MQRPQHWDMFAGMWTDIKECFLVVEQSPKSVVMHGDPSPRPVVAIEDPDGRYYGWLETGSDLLTMVQPHAGMFEMQFPYGARAEVERGKGEIVRLKIEEGKRKDH